MMIDSDSFGILTNCCKISLRFEQLKAFHVRLAFSLLRPCDNPYIAHFFTYPKKSKYKKKSESPKKKSKNQGELEKIEKIKNKQKIKKRIKKIK